MMAIEAQVEQYIAENILFSDNGFEYGHDVSFIQEGIIDSIGVLELVAFVTETFDVVVHDQEVTLENFDSVNNLANFIRRKLAIGEDRITNEKIPCANSLSA
jgi:acyl carrier protein